jgi:membrane associated rhomboid family serine protease
MIPLRDVIPSRTTPVVTIAVIALNSVVFVYQFLLGAAVESFVVKWALVPAAFSWITLVTSMFLHGSFLY